jgi:hypothetical protein
MKGLSSGLPDRLHVTLAVGEEHVVRLKGHMSETPADRRDTFSVDQLGVIRAIGRRPGFEGGGG